jgi:hypothetical protein
MNEEKYTIKEIAEYLRGWTEGSWGSRLGVGASVLHNALQQLEDDQDGIAPVTRRIKQFASKNKTDH